MPVKNMLYDVLEYANQVKKTTQAHKKAKDKSLSSTEYLSEFYKTDKLIPVVTLFIYFGTKKWNAPKCIFDMLS